MPDASSAADLAAVGRSAVSATEALQPRLDPGVAAVVALFEGALAAHAFPGADRATLREHVAGVARASEGADQARAALHRAQEALVAAEKALVAEEATLLRNAHRALAYARVFAEDAPELRASVEAIVLPAASIVGALVSDRPVDADKPSVKRRGRPPRVRAGAPLFEPSAEGGSSTVDTAESA